MQPSPDELLELDDPLLEPLLEALDDEELLPVELEAELLALLDADELAELLALELALLEAELDAELLAELEALLLADDDALDEVELLADDDEPLEELLVLLDDEEELLDGISHGTGLTLILVGRSNPELLEESVHASEAFADVSVNVPPLQSKSVDEYEALKNKPLTY